MSSVPITLRIEVPDGWRVGHTVQAYTDFGTGTIDTDRPLLAKRVEVFPGRVAPAGLGMTPFGSVPFGHGTPSNKTAGFGHRGFGTGAFAGGVETMQVLVRVPDDHALYKFAAQAFDAAGNAQGDPLEVTTAMVSGREPAPVVGFAFTGHDGPSDQVSFTYE